MKLNFYLRYHTNYGESLWVELYTLSNGVKMDKKLIPMEYLNDQFWFVLVECTELNIYTSYSYFLKTNDQQIIQEGGQNRPIPNQVNLVTEYQFIDTWNNAEQFENAFSTDPFTKIFLKHEVSTSQNQSKKFSHIFYIKAPLLKKNEVVCWLSSAEKFGSWNESNPILLNFTGNEWQIELDLCEATFPIAYKYGVYNLDEKKFIGYEKGDNRLLSAESSPNKQTYLNDGFIQLPNNAWKGAGVAIPVFSLRSNNSFGTGEFDDIKLLAIWAQECGIKMIQLLPVNDTSANYTWSDSYPYAAISAFALHPLYLNLNIAGGPEFKTELNNYEQLKNTLNELDILDYEQTIQTKIILLKKMYALNGTQLLNTNQFKKFYADNAYWLKPYCAFCFFRDTYKTIEYSTWPTNQTYQINEIDAILKNDEKVFNSMMFFAFIQFHLHEQLKDAINYAHEKGVVIKGDIPIGVYRNGCDTWLQPELYQMNWQAGAPPDSFTAAGQNWGFPTYNWQVMEANHYEWWQNRFKNMSHYFDAFRIDHILGFFRIWSIPNTQTQGLMGRFIPCIPIHINELAAKGISFDYQRFCKPFITNELLTELFEDRTAEIKEAYFIQNSTGNFDFKETLSTQKEITIRFEKEGQTQDNESLKNKLLQLISNVIFFNEDEDEAQRFHFRFDVEHTYSFQQLDISTQQALKSLYVNYFYTRQNNFWKLEALKKLPALKRASNMLVCGEDLGMVPQCVPEVLLSVGILSLEVQRMPKDVDKLFFNPKDAPYLSVITPSTHDMSTLREWWEENYEVTQNFYANELNLKGSAPFYCEAWICRAIILQHLYSPAMWCIFQLQDLLGMNENIRRENPKEERINNPANPNHYWKYRMHLNLEELISIKKFNVELKEYITNSGR